MKKIKCFISLILIFILCIFNIQAKINDISLEDIYDIKEDYIRGKYEDALEDTKEIISELKEEKGKLNPVLSEAYFLEALIKQKTGFHKNARTLLNKYQQKIEDNYSKDSDKYKEALLNSIAFYIINERYLKIKEIVNKGLKNCNNKDLIHRFKAKKFIVLANQGYFNEAEKLFNEIRPYFENKISKQRAILSNGEKKKLSDGEIQWAKIRFTNIYTEYGNLFVNKGNYEKGKEILLKVEKWYRDHLRNRHSISNKVYNSLARLEEIKGNLDEASDYYDDAISNRLKETSVDYIQSMDNLIRLYFLTGKKARAKRNINDVKETLGEEFGKKSSIYIHFYTIRAHDAKSQGKIYHAEDHLSNALKKDDVLGKNHPLRKRLLYEIYQIEEKTGQTVRNYDLKNAYAHFKDYLLIQKNLIGKNAPLYHYDRVKFAGYLIKHSNEFDTIVSIYNNSFQKVYTKLFENTHKDYIDFMNNYTDFLQLTNQYHKAEENLHKSMDLVKKLKGENSKAYFYQEERKAELLTNLGEYKKAKQLFDKVHDELIGFGVNEDKAYLNSLKLKANIEIILGLYNEAENTLMDAKKVADALREDKKIFVPSLAPYFGSLYLKTSQFKKARDLLENVYLKQKRRYNKISRHKTPTINTLSELYILTGNFQKASDLIDLSLQIQEKIFGKESLYYANALQLKYKNEKGIGDYKNAKKHAQAVFNIQKKKFGTNHVKVGRTMSDLANIMYQKNEELEEVEALLKKSADIIKKNLGKNHPEYAESLKQLAAFYIPNDQLEKARKHLNSALKILKGDDSFFIAIFKKSRKTIRIAEINTLEGDIAMKQGNLSLAKKDYMAAKSLYENLLDQSHPKYVNILSKMAKYHYAAGNNEECISILKNTMKNYITYIDNYFPSLTQREKLKFWNTIKSDFEFFNNVAINFAKKDPSILSKIYNYTLETKSLLLNSSRKIRKRILNSRDQELIKEFKRYLELKELQVSTLSMSEQELEEKDIKPRKLNKKINKLEKKLSEKSEYWSRFYKDKNINWTDIRDNLDKNEVAVEMIRVRHYNKKFTDSVFYAALIIKPGSDNHPELVVLPNGKDMEGRNLVYYKNKMRYSSKDYKSYNIYFKSLAGKIGKDKTVYFSPDGVYNQINLETLMNNNDQYLINNYDIVLVNNTKEIVKSKNKEKSSYAYRPVAKIFANPSYYDYNKYKNPSKELRDVENRVPQLPGSEKEALSIKNLLSDKKWKVDVFIDSSATEKKLKKIEDIKVLHIATHGFFKERKAIKEEDFLSEKINNPMLRSGLLLSDAGEILKDNDINFNAREGILTAYEAMNLNLDNTDLVVLSACETGRGEVQVGEGVYGLQRAFLVAGSESLFMSLFKVSDKVTQKLMEKFYKFWLKNNDIRKSFVKAKRAIKKEYPAPINWGAFVMVGI